MNIRENKEVSERKAFSTGGNSSCQSHIRQHYKLYEDRCEKAGIPENYHAIPRQLWKKMQEEKKLNQLTIEDMVKIEHIPMSKQFTRDGALHAITRFVACDDQALAVVEKPVFCNCLIAMRPKTSRNDLPSTHDLVVHFHNEFELKDEILVNK
jgi:hypothetical protein